MKRRFTCIAAMLLTLLAFASTPQQHHVTIWMNQKSLCPPNTDNSLTQGMAIYGDLMFSMRDKGGCVVTNLKTKSYVSTFTLGSQGENNHVNVAFFTDQRYDAKDKFPLLYISQAISEPVVEIQRPELADKYRLLFVERILTDETGKPIGSQLVQAIGVKGKCWNSRLWTCDQRHPEYIYCYGNTWDTYPQGNRVIIEKFRTPKFDKNQFYVELDDKDAVDTFFYDEFLPEGQRRPDVAILQGATVADNLFFLPTGGGSAKYPSELWVVDMKKRDKQGKPYRWSYAEITNAVPFEMEDMDRWGNKIVCVCFKNKNYLPVVLFDLKNFKLQGKKK